MLIEKKNIAIIGAGKISYSLAAALTKAGFTISIIISKKIESAKNLANKFRIKNFSNELEDIPFKNGIFFLAVPDNQINSVSDNLSKLKFDFQNSFFIHLSGALNISELDSLKKKKAQTASFHVMQSFPSKRISNIKNNFAAIETDNIKAKKFLFDLAQKLSLKSFEIKSTEKTFYHLAGTFASNFLVGNIFNSEILFSSGNKKKVKFYDIINPIVKSTLKNIKTIGVSEALSGPIERGDIQTIKKHLAELRKRKENNVIYFNYIIQSLNLLEIVKTKLGELTINHQKIKKLLEAELKKAKIIG
ncbi:MAG: DUF2520 domain-containing protein [Bacteroidetes bacterium]|nr:DUF2520 domain-containing protein [Bacteroidota bacterium]